MNSAPFNFSSINQHVVFLSLPFLKIGMFIENKFVLSKNKTEEGLYVKKE
jgi:hypothetical protein